MKKIIANTILAMLAISGLLMAGADTNGQVTLHLVFWNSETATSFDIGQLIVCTIGFCVFSVSGWFLYLVNSDGAL